MPQVGWRPHRSHMSIRAHPAARRACNLRFSSRSHAISARAAAGVIAMATGPSTAGLLIDGSSVSESDSQQTGQVSRQHGHEQPVWMHRARDQCLSGVHVPSSGVAMALWAAMARSLTEPPPLPMRAIAPAASMRAIAPLAVLLL